MANRYDYCKLKELVALVIEKNGFTADEGAKVAEVMLCSDLYGIESHGLQRLQLYMSGIEAGRINRQAKMKILKETPVSMTIDADAGLGQPVGIFAMEKAIEKAKTVGFGMVVVNNSNHYGISGYYSRMAAKAGLFGMSMTNTVSLVVPTYGKTPMLGTNPIAVSMPATPTMFHMDISTAVVAAGKMEVYAKAKKPLPEGWSVGSDGKVNTSAQEFIDIRRDRRDGGLLPLGGVGETWGGHKGFGLSIVVELMTGIMAMSSTSRMVRRTPDKELVSHVFQAIDYGIFGDKEIIEENFSAYLQELRDSKKADDQERIFIHGEKEMEAQARVLKEGVYMQPATLKEVVDACEKVGVDHGKYILPIP